MLRYESLDVGASKEGRHFHSMNTNMAHIMGNFAEVEKLSRDLHISKRAEVVHAACIQARQEYKVNFKGWVLSACLEVSRIFGSLKPN